MTKLGVSSATLHRTLNSKKSVEVAFIFQCLGELSSTLPFFISFFIKEAQHGSLRSALYQMTKQVHLEGDFPWLSAIEAFLDTSEYQNTGNHSDQHIAKKLGLSTTEVKQGLKLLLENDAISKDGKKFKLNIKKIDLETNIVDSAKFAHFWTNICSKRFQTPDGVPSTRKGWSSRVFPVSEQAHDELVQLKDNFINDFSRILQLDGNREKTQVQVFILHFFNHLEFRDLKNSKT